jgi:CBS domain-containing protein
MGRRPGRWRRTPPFSSSFNPDTFLKVLDGGRRLRGVLTRDEMIKALKERGPDAPVIEMMRSDVPIVEHRRNLNEALRLIQEKHLPAVGGNDGAGRLTGLITPR